VTPTPTKPIVAGLALFAVFFAILMPPEAYPAGKMAVVVASTFAFLIALSERKIPYVYLLNGIAIFPMLLIHALWLSVDVYRSIEFMTVLWAYYCLLGFFIYASFDSIKPLAATIVALSIIVSVYGLYQYFWGFDELYDYVFYSGSNQVQRLPALDRIATKRVFSTLALPGTLWCFAVAAIPLHFVLWKRRPALDVVLIISALLLLAVGFLTRSFGFLAGLLVLTAAWLFLQHRRLIWNRASAVLLIAAIAGGLFYSARRTAIQDANPAVLRLKNWVSAWNIFTVNPFGTGLNTYGIVYPQYMQPNANETQYAHNTPLQILSELGYPSMLAAIAVILFLVQTTKYRTIDREKRYVLLALIVWLAHNLIDINVYFPSIGVFGVALIGVMFARPQAEFQPRRAMSVALAAMGIGMVAFAGMVLVSSELQHRAQIEYGNSKPYVAIETLEVSKKINPLNSSLFHDSGDILLDVYHKSKNPKYLEAATISFRRAVELSPWKVGPRIGLALSLASANEMGPALEQIHIARRLYPTSAQVAAIIRLMEERVRR
jgi:hypothetical protein